MRLRTLVTIGASLGSVLPLYSQAQAQDAGENAGLTEVIVTGTRRSDVSAIDSAVPTDVVSAEQLAASGSLSLVQSLRSLSPSISFAETGGVIGLGPLSNFCGGQLPSQALTDVMHSARIPNGLQK